MRKRRVIQGRSLAQPHTLVKLPLQYVGRQLHGHVDLDLLTPLMALRPGRGRVPSRACAPNCAFFCTVLTKKDKTMSNLRRCRFTAFRRTKLCPNFGGADLKTYRDFRTVRKSLDAGGVPKTCLYCVLYSAVR